MITTRALKLNILNNITAAASFLFGYSLLFHLYKQLDATVENLMFYKRGKNRLLLYFTQPQ